MLAKLLVQENDVSAEAESVCQANHWYSSLRLPICIASEVREFLVLEFKVPVENSGEIRHLRSLDFSNLRSAQQLQEEWREMLQDLYMSKISNILVGALGTR